MVVISLQEIEAIIVRQKLASKNFRLIYLEVKFFHSMFVYNFKTKILWQNLQKLKNG